MKRKGKKKREKKYLQTFNNYFSISVIILFMIYIGTKEYRTNQLNTRIDQITSTQNPPVPSQKWNFHTTPEPVRANKHKDEAFHDQFDQLHQTKSKIKSKIEALETKAEIEIAQLKLKSEKRPQKISEDSSAEDLVDDSQYGDYNDVSLDESIEINQKNECGINFLTKKSEGIALASFPGSGVTWLRHLIHQSTGFWTGDFKVSEKLAKLGWLGESLDCNDSNLIAVATPRYHLIKKCDLKKAIVLIRNPYKVLLAEFNKKTAGKTKESRPEQFEVLGWQQFLDDNISEYKKIYTDWIRSRLPKTILCFEKMEADPIGTMTSLVSDQSWLNADHVRFRDNCTAGNINGAFKRKHNFDYFGIFKGREEEINGLIKHMSHLLKSNELEDCTNYFNLTL